MKNHWILKQKYEESQYFEGFTLFRYKFEKSFILDGPGGVLEASGGGFPRLLVVLEASEGVLEASWGILGRSWRHLRAS